MSYSDLKKCNELIQLKDQLEEMTEKFQKSGAELKAAKASKQRAESLLEAHYMRSEVERESAEERHRDTIKVIFSRSNMPVL